MPPEVRCPAEPRGWSAGGGLTGGFVEVRFELRIQNRETAQARLLRTGQQVRTPFERSHLAFWNLRFHRVKLESSWRESKRGEVGASEGAPGP